MCLVFLTLGKLSPIPGEQDDQCRQPYQLGQAAGGARLQSLTPVLGASTREAPSVFLFFSHSGFPSPLTRMRKEEIIHFELCAASVAWRLCPRALGGMPAWGMRCHPAAVTSLCPADPFYPREEKRSGTISEGSLGLSPSWVVRAHRLPALGRFTDRQQIQGGRDPCW